MWDCLLNYIFIWAIVVKAQWPTSRHCFLSPQDLNGLVTVIRNRR